MIEKLPWILARLADIAAADIGRAYESPRGSNRGPTLAKYFAADNYNPGSHDEGYPWCAAAVDCWVQEFLQDAAAKRFFGHIAPPRTAAAFGLVEWAKSQGCLIFSPKQCAANAYWPQRGDIAVFSFSHCGIVDSSVPPQRAVVCIEGNTDADGSREGWEVARKPRSFEPHPQTAVNPVRALLRLTPRVPPGTSIA